MSATPICLSCREEVEPKDGGCPLCGGEVACEPSDPENWDRYGYILGFLAPIYHETHRHISEPSLEPRIGPRLAQARQRLAELGAESDLSDSFLTARRALLSMVGALESAMNADSGKFVVERRSALARARNAWMKADRLVRQGNPELMRLPSPPEDGPAPQELMEKAVPKGARPFLALFLTALAATTAGLQAAGFLLEAAALLFVGLVSVSAAWIWLDALTRGTPNPGAWGLVAIVFWPIVLPLYVLTFAPKRAAFWSLMAASAAVVAGIARVTPLLIVTSAVALFLGLMTLAPSSKPSGQELRTALLSVTLALVALLVCPHIFPLFFEAWGPVGGKAMVVQGVQRSILFVPAYFVFSWTVWYQFAARR